MPGLLFSNQFFLSIPLTYNQATDDTFDCFICRCRFTVFGAGAAVHSACSLPPLTRQLSVHGSSGQSGSVEVHRREGNRFVPEELLHHSSLFVGKVLPKSF